MRDTRGDAFGLMGRAFAILTLVLCFSPVLAGDFVPPGKLERVVILSRHGVRSPIKDNDTLQNFRKPTIPPWPDFGVQHPADLTLKGALLMQRMGAHYRKRWAALFEPDVCPNRTFFWADRDERTLMTARALVGGLAGGACDLRVRETTEATDPVFHPCKPPAAENPPVLAEQVGLVQAVLDCCSKKLCEQIERTSCQLQDLMDDKKTYDQAYDFIQSFGEILLFEYAQAFEGNDFAFGKIAPAQKGEWMKLLAIHADLFNKKQRTSGVALLQGANLLYHMAYAIKNGAPLIPPSADGATPVNFVVYVGHDTNIANVAGLLGLQWPAGDYPANDVAPGAALAFEVRRSEPNESNEYVHPVMLAQPPDSLRGDGSEIRSVPLPISGCNGPNGSCAMSDFVKIVKNAIKHDENNACITDWRDLAD